jgi:hypothetical protein
MPDWLAYLLIVLVLAAGAWILAWRWRPAEERTRKNGRQLPLFEILLGALMLGALLIITIAEMRTSEAVQAQGPTRPQVWGPRPASDGVRDYSTHQQTSLSPGTQSSAPYYECVVRAQEDGATFKAAKEGCSLYYGVNQKQQPKKP